MRHYLSISNYFMARNSIKSVNYKILLINSSYLLTCIWIMCIVYKKTTCSLLTRANRERSITNAMKLASALSHLYPTYFTSIFVRIKWFRAFLIVVTFEHARDETMYASLNATPSPVSIFLQVAVKRQTLCPVNSRPPTSPFSLKRNIVILH